MNKYLEKAAGLMSELAAISRSPVAMGAVNFGIAGGATAGSSIYVNRLLKKMVDSGKITQDQYESRKIDIPTKTLMAASLGGLYGIGVGSLIKNRF